MLCCGAVASCASYDAQLATAPRHIPTQHDMLPQHLVCKYEVICEYRNITLARNKAPWWWSEMIETCRCVLMCFIWNYMCIRWLINWKDSTKKYGVTIRFSLTVFEGPVTACFPEPEECNLHSHILHIYSFVVSFHLRSYSPRFLVFPTNLLDACKKTVPLEA